MKIFPEAYVTTLRDCAPGQVIRDLGSGDAGTYSIVCSTANGGRTFLINLLSEGPHLEAADEVLGDKFLAYRGQLRLDVDHSKQCEFTKSHVFGQVGAVTLEDGGAFLTCVPYGSSSKSQWARLNLTSWTLDKYREPMSRAAYFGKWAASLEYEDGGRTKLCNVCEFAVPVEEALR